MVFKGASFLRVRTGPAESHEALEGKLLRNFGLLCLQLLGLAEATADEIRGIEFRCFVKTLLNSEKELERVQSKRCLTAGGVSNKFLTFALCESAPILTRKNIPQIEPCVIYQNYSALLGA